MGNQQSGGAPNTSGSIQGNFVFVQTDQAIYYSGQMVTGRVYLQIVYPFPGNTVHLKVKGKEQSYWKQIRRVPDGFETDTQTGQQRQKYVQKEFIHYADSDIYKYRVPIYQFNGQSQFPPGQYILPFQFQLTSDMAGTFYEKNDARNQCYYGKIAYKVQAQMESVNPGVAQLKHTQQVVVREVLKIANDEIKGSMTVNATTCCCIPQGVSQIDCFFQKNNYTIGETAKIMAEIDNSKCSLDVTDVHCTFNKTLKMKFADGTSYNFSESVSNLSFPGMKAGESAIGPTARSMDLKLSHATKQINPSTNGKYVQCSYSMNVVAVLSGCTCCSSHPSVLAQIVLMPPPPMFYGVQQPPQMWSPQTLPLYNIVFNPSFSYSSKRATGQPPTNFSNLPISAPYGGGMNQNNNNNMMNNPAKVSIQVNPQVFPQQNTGSFGAQGDQIQSQFNGELRENQMIKAATRDYYAKVQSDGNFVLYKTTNFQPQNAIWSSATYGQGSGPFILQMQGDGNLVLYDRNNTPTWSSNTYQKGAAPFRLIMQDDGNLVLYDSRNTPTWATGTNGK